MLTPKVRKKCNMIILFNVRLIIRLMQTTLLFSNKDTLQIYKQLSNLLNVTNKLVSKFLASINREVFLVACFLVISDYH